jgi:TPR repeat protein
MKSLVLLLGVLLLLAGTTLAATSNDSDYNSALLNYTNNNYVKAMEEFKANQNDERSLYMIGVMYEKGEGVPQDYSEAAKWYLMAADKGVAAAMYMLGKLYETGHGVEQNRQEAVSWYRKAAAKKHNNAIRVLKELGEPLEEKKSGQLPKKK